MTRGSRQGRIMACGGGAVRCGGGGVVCGEEEEAQCAASEQGQRRRLLLLLQSAGWLRRSALRRASCWQKWVGKWWRVEWGDRRRLPLVAVACLLGSESDETELEYQ